MLKCLDSVLFHTSHVFQWVLVIFFIPTVLVLFWSTDSFSVFLYFCTSWCLVFLFFFNDISCRDEEQGSMPVISLRNTCTSKFFFFLFVFRMLSFLNAVFLLFPQQVCSVYFDVSHLSGKYFNISINWS